MLSVKRALRLLALLGCLGAFVAVPAAYAQDESSTSTSAEENGESSVRAEDEENGQEGKKRLLVELPSPPAADGTSRATLQREKEAFRNQVQQASIRYTERFAFDTLWNGLSIELDDALQAPKLERLSSVKTTYPVLTIPVPETEQVSDPDLVTAIQMTGADIAQNELGKTGDGVKVAVMDTGVDYDHPDLGGCFGPDCRVAVGHDFVGKDFNADEDSTTYNPKPVPDDDPDDCVGHGTHVAGIVGANGDVEEDGAKGVAPDVTYGAYKVFGCEGSTSSDIMIAAMERVLADEMDVLNISIGRPFQWPQYPTAQASDRLVNKGVSVVASIGNSGANGLYAAGAPGVGEKVIGVSSFDNSHFNIPTFTISPDDTAIGYIQAEASPAPPTSGSAPMARTGTQTTANDACNAVAPPAGSLTGKVALIRRGTCSFYEKAKNAQDAGAAGVVIYNNAPGRLGGLTVAGSPEISIPVVEISGAEGVLIDTRLAAWSVTMTWTDQTDSFPNATGGLTSSFSSYGLTPELGLKPDIGAPGGFVRSTYPIELGSYASASGTSMSSPHVAGAVALLLQAKPNTPPQAVRSILQTSADPKLWWSNPALGFLDNVHRQGAGMLDIDDAILSTTKIEPGKLALGEGNASLPPKTLTIKNSSPDAVTYNLSDQKALSTGQNTFNPSFNTRSASVAFSQAGTPVTSVQVPAGGTATVDVTITPPTSTLPAADRNQYGGYIVLTPQGGGDGQTYRVPYAGFKGDYQSIKALTPTAFNFPWLAKLNGTSFSNQANGATYTLTKGDVPYVLVHLDHQVHTLQMEVFDAQSGKSWHKALDVEYVPRNATSPTSTATAQGSFFALPWDGETQNGSRRQKVPNGTYVIHLSVQKALGDDTNPAHSETWVSPMFTIDRPS